MSSSTHATQEVFDLKKLCYSNNINDEANWPNLSYIVIFHL